MKRSVVRRRFLGTLLATQTGIPWAARAADADTYTMRLSLPIPAATIMGVSMTRFAAAAGRRSNGRLKIEVYPSGQIATETATIQDLPSGVLDFACQSTALLSILLPQFQIFDVPFLFKDLNAVNRFVDSHLMHDLLDQLDAKGIELLGWGFNGFKELESNRPVAVPDDMKGMRVRIQSGAGYVATYQALGAIPIVIDASELFTALTQRTVDAIDVSIDAFTTQKFYTAVKNIAMLDHIISVSPLMASKRKLATLPPDLQKIIREEAKSVSQFWGAATLQRIADAIKFLRENGAIFSNVQHPAFLKAIEPAYTVFRSRIGADFFDKALQATR